MLLYSEGCEGSRKKETCENDVKLKVRFTVTLTSIVSL